MEGKKKEEKRKKERKRRRKEGKKQRFSVIIERINREYLIRMG